MVQVKRGNMKNLVFLFFVLTCGFSVTAQEKDSTTHNWAFSGELFGSAIAISLQGEYLLHRPMFDLTFRTGLGRTSLYHQKGEGFADNLTFPCVISISKRISPYTPFWIELGTGGALDLFESEKLMNPNDRSSVEKDVFAVYRIIPITIGLRQLNKYGFQWRYFVLLNVIPNRTNFIMAGISFGGILD